MRTAGIIVIALAVGFGAGFWIKGEFGGAPAGGPDGTTGATYSAPPVEQGREVPGLAGPIYDYGENVYRGGEPTSIEGAQALRDWGIKTVVSVTPTELERQLCEKYQLNLVELPFEKKPLPGEKIDRFIDVVKNRDAPFYVHCHGGRHRGGILGLIYRIGVLGWDADKAIREFENRGGLPNTADRAMVASVLEHLGKKESKEEKEEK
jgi:hypothetical protein